MPRTQRAAGICQLLISGIETEALLVLLDRYDVMASAAASCASGAMEPSHVLAAMGVERTAARGLVAIVPGLVHAGVGDRPGHRGDSALRGAAAVSRVLVAMSGGVDSSVAAALCQREGHEVVGVTLKLWGGPQDQGCCAVSDVDDARRVCQQLCIDHFVFNYAAEFERDVVEPYVDAHRSGVTPNPCIACNRHVKFDVLADRTRRLGFERLVTGHHVRVVERDGSRRLRARCR